MPLPSDQTLQLDARLQELLDPYVWLALEAGRRGLQPNSEDPLARRIAQRHQQLLGQVWHYLSTQYLLSETEAETVIKQLGQTAIQQRQHPEFMTSRTLEDVLGR